MSAPADSRGGIGPGPRVGPTGDIAQSRGLGPLPGLLLLTALAVALAILRLLVDRGLGGELSLAWPEASVRGLRMTAVVAASAVGIALGVSGVLLQAILRNPLSDPFILGVSGGAGLGVALATAAGAALGATAPRWIHGGGVVAPATIGALAALAATQALGTRREGPDPLTLVLAGVVVSTMCGAAVLFVQHLLPHGARADLSLWMMGRIPEVLDRSLLLSVVGVAVAGVGIGVLFGPAMDVATFGDDEARAIGLDLGRLRLLLSAVAGVLAAAAVALAGPLAFVGLVAPHAARLVLGTRHRTLTIGAALAGASLLLGADLLRQLLDFGAGRVPVGVFAALAGGPVFLVLLRSGRGRT